MIYEFKPSTINKHSQQKQETLTLKVGEELIVSSDIIAETTQLKNGSTVELNENDVEMFRHILNVTSEIKIDFTIKQKMAANILASSKFISPVNINDLHLQPEFSVFWPQKNHQKQIGLMNRMVDSSGQHIVIPTSYDSSSNIFVCVAETPVVDQLTGKEHRVLNIHERRLISDYRLCCSETCLQFADM